MRIIAKSYAPCWKKVELAGQGYTVTLSNGDDTGYQNRKQVEAGHFEGGRTIAFGKSAFYVNAHGFLNVYVKLKRAVVRPPLPSGKWRDYRDLRLFSG